MKHIIFDCDGTLIDTSTPTCPLFPGIAKLLKELAKVHFLYVWTARDLTSTLRPLEREGVRHLFEDFATVTNAPPKPHPGGLAQLVGQRSKNSICVIGDSWADMRGAKHFGVLALGATWCAQGEGVKAMEEVLTAAGADFIVNHPGECSRLILQNLQGES